MHDVDLLVVGVPTRGFRTILTDAKPYMRPWIPVVSLSKGFETGSLLRMSQVIQEVLPGHPAAALTGPNLAKEIMAGQAAASVIATEDPAVAKALQAVLQRGLFRIYTNHDVVGCELGGALKNVVAIATGIAQGLSVGDNTRAAVITRGLAELTRLGVAMGGEARTLAGLAGMGDLIATCMSPLSRNRTLGEQLGSGKTLEEVLSGTRTVAEGVGTAFTAHELAERTAWRCRSARRSTGCWPGRSPPRRRTAGCCASSAPGTSPSPADRGGQCSGGRCWSVARTVRNGSPRSASRSSTVRIVKPSGRSAGSSSSSQSIGADTGAPGAGARAVRRDQRLVDRVLGVVEPGQAAAVVGPPTSS